MAIYSYVRRPRTVGRGAFAVASLTSQSVQRSDYASGGFRKGRAPPPPLSDVLTPSLTVMLANAEL